MPVTKLYLIRLFDLSNIRNDIAFWFLVSFGKILHPYFAERAVPGLKIKSERIVTTSTATAADTLEAMPLMGSIPSDSVAVVFPDQSNKAKAMVVVTVLVLLSLFVPLLFRSVGILMSPTSLRASPPYYPSKDLLGPSISYYGDLSCPLEDVAHSATALSESDFFMYPKYAVSAGTPERVEGRESFVARAARAADFARETKAKARVLSALGSENFSGRRVVLAGEAPIMRQELVGLGCLAGGRLRGWVLPRLRVGKAEIDGAIRLSVEEGNNFQDSGGGVSVAEAYYSPGAGGLLHYDNTGSEGGSEPGSTTRDDGPALNHKNSKNWIDACNDKQPFSIDAFVPNDNGATDSVRTTTVQLGSRDIVFLNAGTKSWREDNQKNIFKLLNCMEEAREKGDANPEWPDVRYFMTNRGSELYDDIKHYQPSYEPCSRLNSWGENREEDIMMYEPMGRLVGNWDFRNWGMFHVGGPDWDCDGWFQPGVPDLYAAEMVETIVPALEVNRNLKSLGSMV